MEHNKWNYVYFLYMIESMMNIKFRKKLQRLQCIVELFKERGWKLIDKMVAVKLI
jgi:hypothetical protein